ncbi:kinesin motor domain-containing protein [Ditylenchus destructor]|nr:kinesin motor domain-containing protein [Ditylenchus destructor]
MADTYKKHKKRRRDESTLEVVCRIKACREPNPCVVAQDDELVRLIPPSSVTRNGEPTTEKFFRFGQVFDGGDSQEKVFKHCCLDLIEDLVRGKSSLLFAYGVTGGGKTYTMTGNKEEPGILPRAADVLFNSLDGLANRCAFYPNGRNGYLIRNAFDAREEQQKMHSQLNPIKRMITESAQVDGFNQNMAATVFVSYIEIYNDNCYDLLDESLTTESRLNMTKTLRMDDKGQMFVENLTEIEVQTSDEILAQYMKAQERRKQAATDLNASSSRSHSIFNIRLVMAPAAYRSSRLFEQVHPDPDESKIIVSQISMVDLAGSERAKRTNNGQERHMEACKINDSLLTLRRCLEQLRQNQRRGNPSGQVSYRDSKLTFVFKTFFEGAGRIRMVLCVNPLSADYDENVHVLNFAEEAQSVKIPKANAPILPLANMSNLPYSRRDVDRWCREAEPFITSDLPKMDIFTMNAQPNFKLHGPGDSESIHNLRDYFSARLAKHKAILETTNSNATILYNKVVERLCMADLDRGRISELESDMKDLNHYNTNVSHKNAQLLRENNALKQRLYRYESTEEAGRRRDEEARARERECAAAAEQQRVTLQKVAEIFETPVPAMSKVATLRKQFLSTEELDDVEYSTPKLKRQRHLVAPSSAQPLSNNNNGNTMGRQTGAIAALGLAGMGGSAVKAVATGYANPRFQHRRSRSQGNMRTLNHQPMNKIPTGTLLQPQFPKGTKHTTKLEMNDLQKCHEYITSKQKVDQQGNLTTDYVKGEIVPTAGGGTAVMFRDVEKLQQESPTHYVQLPNNFH